MSVLSYICDYGSESENSDSELETKRSKLPVPDLSKVPVVVSDTHVDDPELHGGRKRSFPHVRGNWATFVYIRYSAEDILEQILDQIEQTLLACNETWQRCENIHISVSKTVVLNCHLITPFTTALQKVAEEIESFELSFSGVKVYCNEENTRTFLALQADYFSHKYLLKLTEIVDTVLENFKLPTFYEDPSFHMSLFWINGNHKTEANTIVKELDKIVSSEIEKSLNSIIVDSVYCKSGNKVFQYYFK